MSRIKKLEEKVEWHHNDNFCQRRDLRDLVRELANLLGYDMKYVGEKVGHYEFVEKED